MNYLEDNKKLLFKYLFVGITNILIYIFVNFYFSNSNYKEIYMLLCSIVINLVIYYYQGTVKYKWYLDFVINFIIGLIIMFFIRDLVSYGKVFFSLILSNNIIFIRSRLSSNFFKKTLQYSLMFINTVIIIFFNMIIFNLIVK